MEFRKVIVIIRPDRLENVEQALQSVAVPGISVSKVKGYGEYRDFYEQDWMSGHVRMEIFTPREQRPEPLPRLSLKPRTPDCPVTESWQFSL